MRGYMVTVVVALALGAAGCTAPAESEDDYEGETDTATLAVAAWTVDNTGTGCREAFLLFPMSADDVAPHLPEGYTPGDLQALLGTPVPTGSSGAYLTTYTSDGTTNGTMLSSDWGFAVEAPHVEGVDGSTPVNLYSLGIYTANPALVDAFAAAGVAGAPIAPSVTVDILPTGSSTAQASVSDADGVLVEYEIIAPAPAPFTASARFWQSADNGTVYGEYHLVDVPTAQGTATCSVRDGSTLAAALGFTDCAGHGVTGLTLNGAAWDSKYVFLPHAWAQEVA